MNGTLILQFLILTGVISGAIIFALRWAIFNSADGAVKRLDAQTEEARSKQAELSRKIKEADEELAKRQAEAEALTRKMITEAEEKVKEEREKLIHKAREEGEEIITKAQGTRDKIRKELEKEMYLKSIDYAMKILNTVSSERTQGAVANQLFAEFMENLKKVDMSRISAEVATADVLAAHPMENPQQQEITKTLNEKLKREIKINFSVDPQVVGGVILKFGSLALDGSLQNLMKEAAVSWKQKTESE